MQKPIMYRQKLGVCECLLKRDPAVCSKPAAESAHRERVRQKITQLEVDVAVIQRNIIQTVLVFSGGLDSTLISPVKAAPEE